MKYPVCEVPDPALTPEMVILVDSKHYHGNIHNELRKDKIYRVNGWEPLHFTQTEIMRSDPAYIATIIRLKIKELEKSQ